MSPTVWGWLPHCTSCTLGRKVPCTLNLVSGAASPVTDDLVLLAPGMEVFLAHRPLLLCPYAGRELPLCPRLGAGLRAGPSDPRAASPSGRHACCGGSRLPRDTRLAAPPTAATLSSSVGKYVLGTSGFSAHEDQRVSGAGCAGSLSTAVSAGLEAPGGLTVGTNGCFSRTDVVLAPPRVYPPGMFILLQEEPAWQRHKCSDCRQEEKVSPNSCLSPTRGPSSCSTTP